MAETVRSELRQPGIAVVWLEKYAVYQQAPAGTPRCLDYMLLNEVVPHSPADRYTVRGFRGAERPPFVEFGPGDPLCYVNGWYLDRKSASFDSPSDLDRRFPNTNYSFEVVDAKGQHQIEIALGGDSGLTCFPEEPRVLLVQDGTARTEIDPSIPLQIEWTSFDTPDTRSSPDGLFNRNPIFFLLDNARGETVLTSGSGHTSPPLDSTARGYEVPAHRLEPGMRYTAFVSFINFRSQVLVSTPAGDLLGVAVNSVAVELPFGTLGEPRDSRECPPTELRANYRWPGKQHGESGLLPWPVDDSGLRLRLHAALTAGAVSPPTAEITLRRT